LEIAPDDGASAAALAVTLLVIALGAAVYLAYGAVARPAPIALWPERTRYFGPREVSTHLSLIKPFFDARGQTLAHLAMLAATALTIRLGARFGVPALASRLGRGAALLVAVLGLLAPLYAPGPKTRFVFLSLPLALAVLLAGRRRSWGNAALGVLVLGAVALAVVPGFLRSPDFSVYSAYDLTYGQSHWSLVVAPADRLAAGAKLLEDVWPEYGVLLPVLWAGLERLVRPFSFGEAVHLLLAVQALYLALGAMLLAFAARARWLFVGTALAAVVPWYHFAHRSLLFPNQSAWRILGMPMALLALWLVRGLSPRAQSIGLGLLAGGALLLNTESGLAVAAALLVFLHFRHRDTGRLGALVGWFLAGSLLAGVLFVALALLLLGNLPPLARLPRLFLGKAALLSGGGFSGFPWTPDPWPVFVFGHALFVLLQSAFAGRRALGFRPSFRAAAAALLAVWFAYYANRPDPWNLSSYYLVYGVLLVDLLRDTALGFARRRISPRQMAAVACLFGLVLPNVTAIAVKGAQQVRSALRASRPGGATLVGGVYLQDPRARELVGRAEYVAAHRDEPPVFLTVDSYLVPNLAGVFSAMPVVDFCWEAQTRASYERTLSAIARAPRIYLDGAAAGASETVCGVFYDLLRGDLRGSFDQKGEEQGWQIWTRRP
jgi:hypothetical protein